MTAEFDVHHAVERAARDSRQRLIAFLAVRSRDMAAVEDALAEAFLAALEDWPRSGVPEKTEAWLLRVARCRLTDEVRRGRVRAAALPALLAATDAAVELAETRIEFPDERLKLLFVCAHPALDAAMHAPLMLQTVLGLDAARIASAFLVKPAAMGQRPASRPRSAPPASRMNCPRRETCLHGWRPCSKRFTPPMVATGTMLRAPIRATVAWPARRSTWVGCCIGCCPPSPRSKDCWP